MIAECLKGMKVLDLSQYIPGPYAARMLADLGAETIKVEPPAGDPMRSFSPVDPDGMSPFYRLLNRGKTVVRMDLKREEDRALFSQMVAKADVLLESFRPGVMDRLGFDAARLDELNPRLVHCALSGFGQSGPFRLTAGHDVTYLALTGGLEGHGLASGPTLINPPLADHAGAMQAVISVLAALLRRATTGKGCRLDVSLYESALAWQYMGLNRPEPREGGMINGGAAYYRIYETKDGRFVALGPIEDKFWKDFCETVGRPEWIARKSDPFPQTALIAEVEALFLSRPLAEWNAMFAEVDCCLQAVLTPEEAINHPQAKARGLIAPTESGLTDILFPLLMNGAPPNSRPPMREEEASVVLANWR
jgi:alpha-methylacyl-CoA racemase